MYTRKLLVELMFNYLNKLSRLGSGVQLALVAKNTHLYSNNSLTQAANREIDPEMWASMPNILTIGQANIST